LVESGKKTMSPRDARAHLSGVFDSLLLLLVDRRGGHGLTLRVRSRQADRQGLAVLRDDDLAVHRFFPVLLPGALEAVVVDLLRRGRGGVRVTRIRYVRSVEFGHVLAVHGLSFAVDTVEGVTDPVGCLLVLE